jgi:4-aminobutyrate aminotransferase-like enzyme
MNLEREHVVPPVPGTHARELLAALQRYEMRNVTYVSDDFPICWESARGTIVTDTDGNRYIDLTAAFGVAAVGHANPYVASAIADQAARLPHGMGDVHPTEAKIRLLERLVRLVPEGLDRVFLASTGAEAVEAALKTAMLARGKVAFAAFRGAYHGLSLGTLAVNGIERFRAPFASAIATPTLWLDFPALDPSASDGGLAAAADRTRAALAARDDLAAVIVEPIQGRGGCVVPPPGFLSALRAICDDLGLLLIVDEIYTGFGRTGAWFASQHDGIVPDLLCVGKALGGGFPISAVIGRARVMDAWPPSDGEALHTSTFLGNPMGCAAALATIGEIERLRLPERAQRLGRLVASRLEPLRTARRVTAVRGRGLLWGIALDDGDLARRVTVESLQRGIIVLQAGLSGEVIALTPPLIIDEQTLLHALDVVADVIETECRRA